MGGGGVIEWVQLTPSLLSNRSGAEHHLQITDPVERPVEVRRLAVKVDHAALDGEFSIGAIAAVGRKIGF